MIVDFITFYRINPDGVLQMSANPSELTRTEDTQGNQILPNIKSSIIQQQVKACPRSEHIMAAENQNALSKYLEIAKLSVFKDEKTGVWKDKIDSNSERGAVGHLNSGKSVTRDEYYGRVPEMHFPPVKVIMKDPIYQNPNSFESLIDIFRTIVAKNKKREWIIIYSDGVPFLLGKFYEV